MKKIIMTILLLSLTTPAFAQNFVDTLTCKQVKLKAANDRTVLVRRLSCEVFVNNVLLEQEHA